MQPRNALPIRLGIAAILILLGLVQLLRGGGLYRRAGGPVVVEPSAGE